MKKGEFIKVFIEAVFDIGSRPVAAFARESWHYKDLRIGGFNPHKIYQNVNNLSHRGLVKKCGKGRFQFTRKGIEWAKTSAQRYLKTQNPVWDKKWRVVIFDIPQEIHNSRVKLGRKLKGLGFFMLQKSIFIFPYQCESELGSICDKLGISDYVDVLIADKIGFREKELLKFFDLR